MRKLLLALAAVFAVGLTVPVATPVEAQTVVVQRDNHPRMHRHRNKVVIIKRDRRPRMHMHRHSDRVVIVKKRRPAAAVTIRTN